ncbi:MAG: biotin--[acetyl-CoA-carboxylase] ligase [Actinomycetota bacterium]
MSEHPPAVNGDLARSRLEHSRFGQVEWIAETGSTNADLAVRARDGAPEQVLVTDHQTAGRGRLDRRWESPPGAGLLVSVLVRPAVDAEHLALVTLVAGMAGVGASHDVGATEVTLSWPNDVVVPSGEHYRKVAGVLSEAVVGAGQVAVVVGMGCNVDLPPGFAVPRGNDPVSLRELLGSAPDRVELLVAYLRRLAEGVARLETGGPDAVIAEARRAMWTLGREVAVTDGGERISGRAIDLDDVGRLILETAEGRRVVAAGDVRPERGAS